MSHRILKTEATFERILIQMVPSLEPENPIQSGEMLWRNCRWSICIALQSCGKLEKRDLAQIYWSWTVGVEFLSRAIGLSNPVSSFLH